jgi:hypothetical protein
MPGAVQSGITHHLPHLNVAPLPDEFHQTCTAEEVFPRSSRTSAEQSGRDMRGLASIHSGHLIQRFAKTGLEVQTPEISAAKLLAVIDALEASRNGTFVDQHGYTIEW